MKNPNEILRELILQEKEELDKEVSSLIGRILEQIIRNS
jgi:hypothetical protein